MLNITLDISLQVNLAIHTYFFVSNVGVMGSKYTLHSNENISFECMANGIHWSWSSSC